MKKSKKKQGKDALEEFITLCPKRKPPENIDWCELYYSEIEERFKKRN